MRIQPKDFYKRNNQLKLFFYLSVIKQAIFLWQEGLVVEVIAFTQSYSIKN